MSLRGWLNARFEMSHSLVPMEGLRGFAVFLVFLNHYATFSQVETASAHALYEFGQAGVDLFFVISGYLIYGSLIRKPVHFGTFMYRRAERIYPAFTVVFALYLILSVAFPEASKIPEGAGAWLYVVANFLLLPGMLPIAPIITVAWSLSYEMFFYLTVPAFIRLLNLRSRASVFRVAAIIGITLVYAVYCAYEDGLPRLLMFSAGMLLHETIQLSGLRVRHAAMSIGTILVLTPLVTLAGQIPYLARLMALWAGFSGLCWFAFQPGVVARLFSWTPLRWLGNMSYSYYLVHGLALKGASVAGLQWFASENFWAALPLFFIFTLPPAVVLFLLVERPLSLSRSRAHPKAVQA